MTDSLSEPDPLTQLSWKIKLPRGVSIEGRDDITLLKPRVHGQSYVSAYVMYKLGAQLGIPSANVRFVRFNINGEYYSYVSLTSNISSIFIICISSCLMVLSLDDGCQLLLG